MEKKKYTPGKAAQDAAAALQAHREKKPGAYSSQWKENADAVLKQIESRGPFSYNAASDPLYRQAADHYVRMGRRAMMDTMGKASAMTGGYGNSYAQTAGQQSYGEYLQALSQRLPQFQELAFKQYEAGGRDLLSRYQVLSQREKDAYGRYQNTLEKYLSREKQLKEDYDKAEGRDYDRYDKDREYAYREEKDRLAELARKEAADADRQRWEAEQAYRAGRDKTADDQWQREFDEDKRRYELEWAMEHSPEGGSGGSGSGGTRSTNVGKYQGKHSLTEKEYEQKKKDAKENGHYGKRPAGRPWSPGLGPSKRPNSRVDLGW